jgi:hypothetical protein
MKQERKKKSSFRQDTQEIALKREADPCSDLSPLPRWPCPLRFSFSGGETTTQSLLLLSGGNLLDTSLSGSFISTQSRGMVCDVCLVYWCVVTSILLLWGWVASLLRMSAWCGTVVCYTQVCAHPRTHTWPSQRSLGFPHQPGRLSPLSKTSYQTVLITPMGDDGVLAWL